MEDLATIRIGSAFRRNCLRRGIREAAASLGTDRAGRDGNRREAGYSCGRSAVVPVNFSRYTFSHPAAFNWASWLVRSCAPVETRS